MSDHRTNTICQMLRDGTAGSETMLASAELIETTADMGNPITVKQTDLETVARALWIENETDYSYDEAVNGAAVEGADGRSHRAAVGYIHDLAGAALSAMQPEAPTTDRAEALREVLDAIVTCKLGLDVHRSESDADYTNGVDAAIDVVKALALIDTPPPAQTPTVAEADIKKAADKAILGYADKYGSGDRYALGVQEGIARMTEALRALSEQGGE